MLRLLRLAKPYWLLVILGPLFMMVEVASQLVQPRFMASIVDQGIAKGDLGHILRTGGLMLVVALVGMLFGLAMIVVSSIASQRYGADLRLAVFGKVLHLPTQNLDPFGSGALITRLTSDVMQMQQLLMILMRMLVRAPMLCFGSIAMAVSMSPQLSRVFWIAVPLLFALMWLIQAKSIPLFRKVQESRDRVNSVTQENLAGVRVVRSFGRQDHEVARFGKENRALEETGTKAARVMGILDPAMSFGMNLTIAAVVWLGGNMISTVLPNGASAFTVGQMMAFISYTSQVMFALIRNGVLVNALARSKASADRLNEVMDTASSLNEKPDPLSSAIADGRVEFRNVTFSYPGAGGEPVLQNVSFVAEPGKTTAIIGVTGSGKSTLVSLIPRMYDVNDGQVLVDEVDVKDYGLEGLRRGIGMVMQETLLFQGQIQDNLRWGLAGADPSRMKEAAVAAEAHEFVDNLPDTYGSQLGQRGSGLSGGQKQRLSIARALIRKPKILILDDATSSVDLGTESRIHKALRDKDWKATTLIIAQRVSTVMDADQILVLHKGRVAGKGTHEELIRDNAIYRDIVRSQFGEEAV